MVRLAPWKDTMILPNIELNPRDDHHWDVYLNGNRRYTIRGSLGAITVQSEGFPSGCNSVLYGFATVLGAMTFILDQSIHEIS